MALDRSSTNETTATLAWRPRREIAVSETRNLLLLAAHQIIFRVGWIFKTESVIMPAVLDKVAGAGWIRGLLPILNRVGQSLPPVFAASRIQRLARKKTALAVFTLCLSLPFFVLSAAWSGLPVSWDGAARHGSISPLAAVFLAMYLLFFVFNGLYHLSFGTVQGKLIRPTRRGHLLRLASFGGSIPAMLLAWWLLSTWLEMPGGGFARVFAFTAICFFLSGLVALGLREPRDGISVESINRRGSLSDFAAALGADANLRRLVAVAMLFGCSLIVFPHYQAFAREELGLSGSHLMVWVVVQNGAVGLLSLVVGPLADSKGNRLTLEILVFGSAAAPSLACLLGNLPDGGRWFWLVFVPLAVTPMVLRVMVNYTLEICTVSEHPRYLSTVAVGLAVPFVASPLVGWIADSAGFRPVFLAAAGAALLGGLLTRGLLEPRHGHSSKLPVSGPEGD